MLSGMKAMTVPDLPCQKSILYTKKQYYVPFYFANEKIFYAEDRAKMDRELTSLFCGKLDFWRGRSDMGITMRSWLS